MFDRHAGEGVNVRQAVADGLAAKALGFLVDGDLEARFEAGAEVTPDSLVTVGLLKNTKIDIKILASGELTKKLSVTAHGFSKSAREKIEAAGGSITWLRGEPVVKKAKKHKAKPVATAEPDDAVVVEEAPAAEEPVAEETAEATE